LEFICFGYLLLFNLDILSVFITEMALTKDYTLLLSIVKVLNDIIIIIIIIIINLCKDEKVKLSLCLTKYHAMKAYWRVDV
jgi:hypothetical protein